MNHCELYNHKIVGYEVRDAETGEPPGQVLKRTTLVRIHVCVAKPVLHGDNGRRR